MPNFLIKKLKEKSIPKNTCTERINKIRMKSIIIIKLSKLANKKIIKN